MGDEIRDGALTQPDAGLFEALLKKLSAVDRDRLRVWLDTERQAAAHDEWERQKSRVEGRKALLAQRDALAAALRGLVDLWPLSGYELEAYCDATLIPAARAALALCDQEGG
jgi:hypothetical protein